MKLLHLTDIEEVGVSHNPEVKKKVILEKNYIPRLMTFGQAVLQPGQAVTTHKHETMFEVFYIQSGKAIFTVNDQPVDLSPNDCIVIEPGEPHSQNNPYSEPVTWLYFGVATNGQGPKKRETHR